MTPEFNQWWNGDDLSKDSPFRKNSPAYWAWEGWLACVKALEQPKQEPKFCTHNVEQPHDWSEWVCPNPKGYLMKCCDCGLVHEAEFGVVRFKSETELEDCEPVNDPNLQAVFRMRRSEQWLPEDTAHRAGGLPMAQPKQEPVLQDIEQYRIQMAGICTAAIGYWKEADGIHPDYDTVALRDVAKLYAKYDALYKAQQKQEPMAWYDKHGMITHDPFEGVTPLYTEPPEKEWVGLTEEEIGDALIDLPVLGEGYFLRIARAIENKLKERNA